MAGRPPIWENAQEFDAAIEKYFTDEKLPTWTGLAIHLGFESRQSLQDYKEKEEFSYSIKKALLRIENQYEKALLKGNPGGPIFALKNFNWKDKQEVDQKTEHSGGISIKWEDPDPGQNKGSAS